MWYVHRLAECFDDSSVFKCDEMVLSHTYNTFGNSVCCQALKMFPLIFSFWTNPA